MRILSLYFIFSLILLCVASDILEAKSKFLQQKYDYKTPQKELSLDFPEFKEDIDEVFRSQPIYTNTRFRVKVEESILHKMFSDIPFSAEKAAKYTPFKYIVTEKPGNKYFIKQPPYIEGNLIPMLVDTKNNRYVYLAQGIFRGPLIFRGKMVVDIRFKDVNNVKYFNVKAYVTLQNDTLWITVNRLTIFDGISKKLDKIIDFNVRNIVRAGIKTALGIQREENAKLRTKRE